MKWWSVLGLLVLGALGGCEPETVDCNGYDCSNSARMSGSLAAPAAVRFLDVSCCREQSCLTGLIDLDDDEPCLSSEQGLSLCVRRAENDRLEIEGSQSSEDNGKVPPDAEYTVRLVDHDSGDLLLEDTQTAKYEIAREDACHSCSTAVMEFAAP